MPRKKKLKFEDCVSDVDFEINKRRSKWNLTALAWMDFDDVSQILRIHIHKKWHLYDQIKPLAPWINRIITNQIKNLIRNNYGNFTRPCLRCAAAEGENNCLIYKNQEYTCPLLVKWFKTKKIAYDVKLAVPLEIHLYEVQSLSYNEDNFNSKAKKLLGWEPKHTLDEGIKKTLEWYKIYYK